MKSNDTSSVSKEMLVKDIHRLGVQSGDTLNLKVALSSIGRVEGGAATVVEALLEVVGSEGTIVADSFVSMRGRPKMLNGVIQDKPVDSKSPSPHGAFANAMIAHPLAVRSLHPVKKFSAIGARARELMLEHTASSAPNDVLRKMTHSGGRNLKIGPDAKVEGVGTTHVVMEDLKIGRWMGRRGVCMSGEGGKKIWWNDNSLDCCAAGLGNLLSHYESSGCVISEGVIGAAPSKLTSMAKTHEIETKLISSNPQILHCERPACLICRCLWLNSRQSVIGFSIRQLFSANLSGFKLGLRHWISRRNSRSRVVEGYEERSDAIE